MSLGSRISVVNKWEHSIIERRLIYNSFLMWSLNDFSSIVINNHIKINNNETRHQTNLGFI